MDKATDKAELASAKLPAPLPFEEGGSPTITCQMDERAALKNKTLDYIQQ